MSAKKVEKTKVLAELFNYRRRQAVRLPEEFWFDCAEVRISRIGEGVLLEPILPEREEKPIPEV